MLGNVKEERGGNSKSVCVSISPKCPVNPWYYWLSLVAQLDPLNMSEPAGSESFLQVVAEARRKTRQPLIGV